MPKELKNGTDKKVLRGESPKLILSALHEGKQTRKEILDYAKKEKGVVMIPRTFTKAIKQLIDKKMVQRVSRGRYILCWNITLEEAVQSIEDALQRLAEQYETVTLEDISVKSKVPTHWKTKLGKKELTFSDIAWGLSRKLNIEIGHQKSGKPIIRG
jgi:hypothetical protein